MPFGGKAKKIAVPDARCIGNRGSHCTGRLVDRPTTLAQGMTSGKFGSHGQSTETTPSLRNDLSLMSAILEYIVDAAVTTRWRSGAARMSGDFEFVEGNSISSHSATSQGIVQKMVFFMGASRRA